LQLLLERLVLNVVLGRILVGELVDGIARSEHQQRAMLRLSLGDETHELPLRQGRAIAWLSEALDPLIGELGEEGVRRLAIAIRSTCGIEARVWLTDIASLDANEIKELQLWIAQALVAQARRGADRSSGRDRPQ